MLKQKDNQNYNMDAPATKIPRIYIRQVKGKEKLKNLINIFERPRLNLCDLPMEIFEKIFGYLGNRYHYNMRATCRRLKDISNYFLMHEFQKALHKYSSIDPKSEASAGLYGIKQATEVYVRSGFESTFCGCLLLMLQNGFPDPFCPHISQIKQFLTHFYAMISDQIDDTTSQLWRLLYTITLMRIVKDFDKTIISSFTLPYHWRTVVALRGPWLGKLLSSEDRPQNQSRHRFNLLVMLSEMLISNICGRYFRYLADYPNEVYAFGNDNRRYADSPTALFTFTVYSPKKISNIFRSCLEDDEFQWPSKWPNDQFTVNFEIVCKEAIQVGCARLLHIELGPFCEEKYGEENMEEDLT